MRSGRIGSGSFAVTAVMSRLLIPLLTTLFIALVAGAAGAESPKDTGDPAATQKARPTRRSGTPSLAQIVDRHAEQLGLDDETRAKIEAIASEAQPETTKLREKLQEQNQAMRELLSQDEPDVKAVMKQADRLGAAETELQKQRLRTMLAIRGLLTPEQRAELSKLQHDRRAMRGPKPGPPKP